MTIFKNESEALDWALTYIEAVVNKEDLKDNEEYRSAVNIFMNGGIKNVFKQTRS